MLDSEGFNYRIALAFGFRACVIGQAIAVFSQAVLAGLALSGNPSALSAHTVNGGIALLMSRLQLILALVVRSDLPPWAPSASFGLCVAEGLQMLSGRRHLFSLHLPVGVALFAVLARLVLWLGTKRSLPLDEKAGDDVAIGSPLVGASVGGKQ